MHLPTINGVFHGSHMTLTKTVTRPSCPAKLFGTHCGRPPASGLEVPLKVPPREPQSSWSNSEHTQLLNSDTKLLHGQPNPVWHSGEPAARPNSSITWVCHPSPPAAALGVRSPPQSGKKLYFSAPERRTSRSLGRKVILLAHDTGWG